MLNRRPPQNVLSIVEATNKKGQHNSINKLLFLLHKSYLINLVSLHIFHLITHAHKAE